MKNNPHSQLKAKKFSYSIVAFKSSGYRYPGICSSCPYYVIGADVKNTLDISWAKTGKCLLNDLNIGCWFCERFHCVFIFILLIRWILSFRFPAKIKSKGKCVRKAGIRIQFTWQILKQRNHLLCDLYSNSLDINNRIIIISVIGRTYFYRVTKLVYFRLNILFAGGSIYSSSTFYIIQSVLFCTGNLPLSAANCLSIKKRYNQAFRNKPRLNPFCITR